MMGRSDGVEPAGRQAAPDQQARPPPQQGYDPFDVTDLAAKANAVVEEHEANSERPKGPSPTGSDSRHDSAQDKVPQVSSAGNQQAQGRVSPSLKLQTTVLPRREPPPDTIATSPTLSKHLIATAEGAIGTLPAFQAASPARDGNAISPPGEKLPGFQQVVAGQLGPLGELAEAATQHGPKAGPQHHQQSFGSSTAPSPMLQYAYAQTSPSPYYVGSARSPTSAISDQLYHSPTQFPPAAYYHNRRTSMGVNSAPFQPPPLLTASSSSDSHGTNHTNSSVDSYNTSLATPSEATSDGTPRPILPPPPGMPQSAVILNGGFKCDFPGCTAASFQTQYLLRQVHPHQVRNHYCPVKDCPRSEGGRGFKRKNEMIRHGLVHDSPGYVCPFCADKEHKYPRPDNLQRHVRVHHVDKDKDDPLLREVLAQRREGLGKTRRRRANTAGSAS